MAGVAIVVCRTAGPLDAGDYQYLCIARSYAVQVALIEPTVNGFGDRTHFNVSVVGFRDS